MKSNTNIFTENEMIKPLDIEILMKKEQDWQLNEKILLDWIVLFLTIKSEN